MPADSEDFSYRPLGVRMVGTIAGLGLLAVCVGAWIALGPEVRDKFTLWQRTTLLAIVAGGGVLVYALVRARITVRGERVVVVNGYRRHVLERAQVLNLRLRRGAPWAEMDLADGTSIPVMAIQGSDGDRARRGLRRARELLAAPVPGE